MKVNRALVLAAALLAAWPALIFAQIRNARDPAVKAYLKAYTDRVKAEKQAEREARRSDPNQRLRPYLSLDEIYAALHEAAAAYPELARVVEYGRSVEGRPLLMLVIRAGEGPRPRILYSANIHGNELAGDLICLALIDYFLAEYDHDRDVAFLLERLEVDVIPVLNPDGMAATVEQQVKLGAVFTLTRKNADRVDLNRNFPYPAEALARLHDTAGSSRRFSPNYRGPRPLSEPETQALDQIFAEYRFLIHCNYHTTGGLVMSPPATLPEPLPDDDLHARLRRDYRAAMFDPYREHTELEFYPTIGSLDDYLYHRYGTLCVTMEVGKNMVARMLGGFHNGTWSPLFWGMNVYAADREVANNLAGALALAEWALKLQEDPGLIQWQPSGEPWVGEPEPEPVR